MKKTLLCLIVAMVAGSARSEESTAAPKLPGRPETSITLDFGEAGKKAMTFPPSLYVTPEGWITILPGEEHTVEFDIVDGQPKNLRYLADSSKRVKPGTGRLTVSLTQGEDLTMLLRQAESLKPLAMRCVTQSYGEDKFRQTRLNPVGDLPYSDSWANTVCSVMLGEIRFAEESKQNAEGN